MKAREIDEGFKMLYTADMLHADLSPVCSLKGYRSHCGGIQSHRCSIF